MSFTPGPWSVRKAKTPTDNAFDYGIGAALGGKERCIAEAFARVDVDIYPDAEANARLISAAPDLLEALIEVREMLFARPDIVSKLRPLMGFAENATSDRAAAAIAKAKGEST